MGRSRTTTRQPAASTTKEPEPETTVTDVVPSDGRLIVTCSNGHTYQVGAHKDIPALLKSLG